MRYSNNPFRPIIIDCLFLALLITLASVLVACERTPLGPEYEQSSDGLGLTVRANQAFYLIENSIGITLKIVNLTERDMDTTTADSQLYDIKILNQDNENVWQFGYQHVFGQVITPFNLKPYQQKSYVVVCKDNLEAGQYTAIGWFMFFPTLRDTTKFIILDGDN